MVDTPNLEQIVARGANPKACTEYDDEESDKEYSSAEDAVGPAVVSSDHSPLNIDMPTSSSSEVSDHGQGTDKENVAPEPHVPSPLGSAPEIQSAMDENGWSMACDEPSPTNVDPRDTPSRSRETSPEGSNRVLRSKKAARIVESSDDDITDDEFSITSKARNRGNAGRILVPDTSFGDFIGNGHQHSPDPVSPVSFQEIGPLPSRNVITQGDKAKNQLIREPVDNFEDIDFSQLFALEKVFTSEVVPNKIIRADVDSGKRCNSQK
jgi:hypothetical protein